MGILIALIMGLWLIIVIGFVSKKEEKIVLPSHKTENPDVRKFLDSDNSYLEVPYNTTNERSQAFWDAAKSRGCTTKDISERREAYESGVEIGYELGINAQSHIPCASEEITEKERRDFETVLSAFGLGVMFIHPTWNGGIPQGYNSGMNLCKNYEAYNAGIVLDEETKEKIINIIQNYRNEKSKTK